MHQRGTAKNPKQAFQVRRSSLSAWQIEERTAGRKTVDLKRAQKHEKRKQQSASVQPGNSTQDHLEQALTYFERVKDYIPLKKNEVLQKHLTTVESIALQRGLSPEGLDVLLNVALSGHLADTVNTRILKCLIPASVIAENSVVSAVSRLCVGKCSGSTQLLFLRWLIAMFDFIDHKEKLHALYGFFFCSLQDEKLCPYVCHLLYLLTRRESVKPFRVRRLVDLQAKMGMQPHLQALLSLYKLFCPELVSITLPAKTKTYFKNSESLWKAAINTIRRRNQGTSPTSQQLILGTGHPQSRKRKWNTQLILPACSADTNNPTRSKEINHADILSHSESFPVEQLHTFSQLLQNIHCLEFPSQMGSVLRNSLLLHYINCVKDESIYLRLYYWMGQTLQEECTWYKLDNQQYEEEFKDFLDIVYKTECFLQEGFSSCEEFLYKSLPLWDGFCCRSQILRLVSWIPLSSFSEMKPHLCEPLAQLFFTSSLYFKCSVLESLKELLQNWLNWHVIQLDMESDPKISPLNTTLSGLVNSVAELIHFVGWIATVALRLENNATFLLYFILDFYETVCDVYLKYNLPLLVMPPPGVFYPALLSMDAVSLNQLCYIMYRYRTNLVAAKENELIKKTILQFKFSSQTYQEYNQYIMAMVGCLWTSSAFQKDIHPQGIRLDPEVLKKTKVQEVRNSFNIVHHPALMGYAILFLQQAWPEDKTLNFNLIKGRRWNWYLEYLYVQGLQGLKLFIESSINRVSQVSQTKSGNAQV
ncbi:centromere protein I [Chelonoidis abingdonii]|uniref:centromere protein I n=1 Tax=Chelonoidis abingdonii TaxID=106734 RepID=UPI0013F21300|nr:centromere protein I isoform X1 [Chelonoidis abingdonii]XP_032628083.1 centromere protein I isoform X1 [Chelonoidis abingdonii]